MPDQITQFGFTMGHLAVTRLWGSDEHGCAIEVRVEGSQGRKQRVTLYTSPKGNRVRVFLDGDELVSDPSPVGSSGRAEGDAVDGDPLPSKSPEDTADSSSPAPREGEERP